MPAIVTEAAIIVPEDGGENHTNVTELMPDPGGLMIEWYWRRRRVNPIV